MVHVLLLVMVVYSIDLELLINILNLVVQVVEMLNPINHVIQKNVKMKVVNMKNGQIGLHVFLVMVIVVMDNRNLIDQLLVKTMVNVIMWKEEENVHQNP